jgi:hypothetical protein
MMKMGPNDARRVVWAIGTCLIFFFHVSLILTSGFCSIFVLLVFLKDGEVRLGGDDKNGPKRLQMCRLGIRYVPFFFVFFIY